MNTILPRISIFVVLLFASLNPVIGQIDSTRYMDYKTFPKELSADIIPILGGSNPSSLFYRNNYQRENARPMAFRLQLNIFNNFSFAPDNGNALNNSFINAYGLQLGKEWQKGINNRMLAYSGVDFGFAYGSNGNRAGSPRASGNIYLQKQNRFVYTSTIFFGVKYHFTQRFSASAEMGIQPTFQRRVDVIQFGSFNVETRERDITDTFGVSLLPLNALRLSYHF